jgi:vacuolar protein sorting-associated protein 45
MSRVDFAQFSQTAKDYVQRVVRCTPGPKVLLVDGEVIKFLNVSFSHSQLLSHEVFVVDELRKADRTPMKHFSCVIFARPTQENFQAVTAELERGRDNYKDFFLFFTNMFSIDQMQFLVRSDQHGMVKHVEEVYLDMFPVTDEACIVPLFNSNAALLARAAAAAGADAPQLIAAPLFRNPITINQWDNADLQRVTEGIVAMTLACGRRPHIRYRANNRVTSHLASALGSRARNLRHRFYDLASKDCVLLLLDRMDDPITPLITPWTYQALCHELLGIDSGVVTTVSTVRKPVAPSAAAAAGADGASPISGPPAATAAAAAGAPGTPSAAGGAQPPQQQYATVKEETQHVLSAETDSFFRSHRDTVWGELCIATKGLVDAFLELNKVDLRTKSLQEIGAIKERMPEMRRQNVLAERHSTIVAEMGKSVKARGLSNISVLEQDIVCGAVPPLTDFTSYAKRFLDAIGDRVHVSDPDALRIAVLFELRYEHRRDTAVSASIRSLLRNRGLDLRLLDAVVQLGGLRARQSSAGNSSDLFPQERKASANAGRRAKDFFKSFAKALKEFGGDDSVSSVWVRHVPYLQTVLTACARGTLSEQAFPFYGEGNSKESSADGGEGGGGAADGKDAAAAAAAAAATGVGAERPKEIIIFMVGGMTYTEALLVKRINEATAQAALGNPARPASVSATAAAAAAAGTPANAGGTGSDADGDEGDDPQQRDPEKVPPELIGCRVLIGSTAMLNSRKFFDSLPTLG